MLLLVQILAGFFLLTAGAEVLVRGAVALAKRLGISAHVIGLTVVGFGTSAPELIVSLQAALNGVPGIALGNVIGSNISNILLLIGIGGLMIVLPAGTALIRRDGAFLLVVSIGFLLVAFGGEFNRLHGVVMLAILSAYITYSYWHDQQSEQEHGFPIDTMDGEGALAMPAAIPLSVFYVLLGLGAVLYGGHVLVEGAVEVARMVGISETIIGVTLVAIGTSLPEVATVMVAALKGHTEVALGNVIGSCLFNILAIIGAVAVVTPLAVADPALTVNLWILLAVTVFFVLLSSLANQFGRPWAIAFLTAYVGFIIFQFQFLPGLVG